METEQVLENCIGYKVLKHALGISVTEELLLQCTNEYPWADDSSLELMLKMESLRLSTIAMHFARLRLSPMPLVSYSKEEQIIDAAKWIFNASTSKNPDVSSLCNTIRHYINDNIYLGSVVNLTGLKVRVSPGAKTAPRIVSTTGSDLPSSIAGMKLLDMQLRRISGTVVTSPKYLFAWIVGYHGFPDGNGRTGRAAYAIEAIRRGCFVRLTRQEENTLSGLSGRI